MAKDIYHELVKQALINEGWEITHDPYYLSVGIGRRNVAADFGLKSLLLQKKIKRRYWWK